MLALLDFLDNFSDWLTDFSDSGWLPLLIFVIALLDSFIPIVPSETLLIVGGVAAGQGDQNIAVVILCGALGAFCGDHVSYQLGRSAEPFLRRTLFRGAKGEKRLDWAGNQLDERGALLLVTARFIPGGRTVVTAVCGATERSRKWFARGIALAATIWATYAGLLGYIGGKAFEDNHTKAFVVAFTSAISVTVVIELIRWLRHRNKPAPT